MTTGTSKRGHALNGDLFRLSHPAMSFDEPFTTFIDLSFRGTNHQAFAAADQRAFNFANATGEFTVGHDEGARFPGLILETLDAVETQVSHRYQAVVRTDHGVLSVHSYASVAHLLALVGALRPSASRLGVVLDPDDEIEFTSAPKVALTTEIGIVELTPLTTHVIDELPRWAGTTVAGGQLYGGQFTDGAGYLTLVTTTCRVLALPGPDVDMDVVATVMADLEADWYR